jgi:putative hydrolase of the HAD superfamily
MPGVDGVLFDYGQTLVTFSYPSAALLEVVGNFRPTIEEATGSPAPSAETILNEVLMPLEGRVQSESEDEVDWLDEYRSAWAQAGMYLPEGLLYEILDAEQGCWDRAVRVDPEAASILSWLGSRGIKRAICSNAPFPPEMMLRQLRINGVDQMVDGVVFSSQIGRRKPAPEMYRAALGAIGVAPERAIFVGNRVREDYDGPRALGMRAVIVTAHNDAPPPDGIPAIAALRDVQALV